MERFFENVLTDKEEREEWLRESLFQQAIEKHDMLLKHEVFTFTPVLAMGGAESIEYIEKGNAQIYQDIVFQMTM